MEIGPAACGDPHEYSGPVSRLEVLREIGEKKHNSLVIPG